MSGGAAEADVTVSLPKLTDEDFASAFRKARMSSWNVRKDLAIDDGVAASLADGQQVLVFGGLIDILQVYGARKRLEHHYKAFRYRSEKEGISVTDPATYATRMSGFIWTKFSEMPRAGAVAGTDGATLEPHPEETSVELELENHRLRVPRRDWARQLRLPFLPRALGMQRRADPRAPESDARERAQDEPDDDQAVKLSDDRTRA